MAHEVGSDPASDRVLFHRPDEPRLFAREWPGASFSGRRDSSIAARDTSSTSRASGSSRIGTLITTGDHDDRVVPAHSFKFAAALQHAVDSQTDRPTDAGPILLSVDTRAGHGMGKPRDARVREFADQLAFAAHHTGLRSEASPPASQAAVVSVAVRSTAPAAHRRGRNARRGR